MVKGGQGDTITGHNFIWNPIVPGAQFAMLPEFVARWRSSSTPLQLDVLACTAYCAGAWCCERINKHVPRERAKSVAVARSGSYCLRINQLRYSTAPVLSFTAKKPPEADDTSMLHGATPLL